VADAGTDPLATTAGWGRWRTPYLLLVIGAVVAGVALRFVTRSPLWLDEALSVNIASLPLGEIPGALRRDGHPPLYYVLLHGWMEVFGRGPVAVRALSGVWSVALLPLLWVAGRRLGGPRVAAFAVVIGALSPFAIRYGTETRMYAMVSVLALAGWLLVDDARRRPERWRLAAIAVVTAALLWTHYWAIWLLAATTLAVAWTTWRARRDGRRADTRAGVSVLVAMVVGGVAFLPWVPTLLYQGARTGTPWARAVRPTEMVTFTVADLGGGPDSEAVLLGWLLVLAAVVGLCGQAVSRSRIDIDLRIRERARPLLVAVAGTAAIAWVVSYASGSTYAGRYASVFFPFVVLLAALGLDQLRSRPGALGALAVLAILGGIGGLRNVAFERSDAARTAAALDARGEPGDVVVYCPDQLGPSSSRLVAAGFDQVTFPDFAGPERVDWVDYTERVAAADVGDFADGLFERAGDRRIFLVYSNGYSTHATVCPALFNAIGARRQAEVLTQLGGAYEPASTVVFEVDEP
jgi:mannosyltransferase